MYKRHILLLIVCLLALIPLGTRAQQLTAYEYWFDGDLSTLESSETLSGSVDGISVLIPTQDLSEGLHTFYFRALQSDGYYSPVTSSVFFKHNACESSLIEYWFDDDFDGRNTMTLPSSAITDLTDITLSMEDNAKLPLGLHQLHLRMATKGKSLSAVYSAWVLKMGSGAPEKIEYWVDDYDKDNPRFITGHKASSADSHDYVFTDPFDLKGVSPGLHRIYYRATSDNGVTNSAVYMTTVTVGCGETPTLEYWIDDAPKSVSTQTGHAPSSGDKAIVFNKPLDLSKVSPGIHRLNYRAVGNNGTAQTPISSTPILVKSKYNVANPEELTVTEHSYWFDDEEPKIITEVNPENIFKKSYNLDARKLSEGQHTLHMRFGNSADIWNGPVDYPFTKTKVADPVITATATEEEGVVTFKFNTVPHGMDYTIVRQYPSGKNRKAEVINNNKYPIDLQSIDKPGPGTYTYYVLGRYLDADGIKQTVRSNEMSVTVANAAKDVKRATFYGVLTLEGKRINYPSFTDYMVFIKDALGQDAEYKFNYGNSGTFTISNIPYGTELTVSVKNNSNYYFKDMKLIVNESTSNNKYIFDGVKYEDADIPIDNDAYDLVMTEKVHITPSTFELKVKNKSNKPWSGNIIVKLIRKKVKDLYEREANGGVPLWYYIIHKDAGIDDGLVYKTAADQHITLEGWTPKTPSTLLLLDITDLPEKDEAEDYYVYVYSKKDGTEQLKELEGCAYPETLNFNPFDCLVAVKKGFISYMKGYAEVMRIMKEFSSWGDPFKHETGSIAKAYDLIIKNLDGEEVDIEDLLKDELDVALKSSGMLLNYFFSDMHKAVKKYSKTITESSAYTISGKMKKLYDRISGSYSALKADDDHQYFKLAREVLNISKDLGADPVLDCYKTYFDIGDAMVNAIERLSKKTSAYEVWNRLFTGKGVYKIKVRKYTSPKEGKKYFSGSDLYPHKEGKYKNIRHQGMIDEITIKLVDPTYTKNNVTSEPLKEENVVLDNDGITIKNVTFPNNPVSFTDVEAWMTIKWKNNRVTHVPLLDEDFVKVENKRAKDDVPLIMTVELQSETYYNVESIPNKLTFVEP